MKKTAVNEIHKKLGGKMVDFAGWEMPIQYKKGVIKEHMAVREKAGIFDVSHMGEFEIKGKDALKYVENLITNNASKLDKGQVLYTTMCYEKGTIVDDLLVYRLDKNYFYFVINSSNHDKDFNWLKKNAEGFELEILKDLSPEMSLFAVQGPKAEDIINKLMEEDLSKLGFFRLMRNVKIGGVNVKMISRTGYTGEDGVEIMLKDEDAPELFKKILEAGEEFGIEPCGLGARDTLRLEAKLMLYGNDIDDTTTPIEAALKWTVDLDKGYDFNGKEVIEEQIKNGVDRYLKGFEMIDRGIARHGMDIYNENDKKIGYVTSGNYAPYLKKNIGLGYIDKPYHKRGTEIYIDIRGKKKKAEIVKTPFYKKSYKK